MAPQKSPKRRLNNTPTLPVSAEAASDDVCLLLNSNNINENVHPADNPQIEERDTYSALVRGREMLVPRTYDPDTYDFDARMPWTPEPEPYDPETYSAWGRKHFGVEWYQLRKFMLEERNPHDNREPVYIGRQQALRVMEHQAEGRSFRPYSHGDDLKDEGWKPWNSTRQIVGRARMSNNELCLPRSPSPPSAPPTPREPWPIPADPWKRIEYMRRRWDWTEEMYHFDRFFLREEIIDGNRSRRENELGNRQAREKRELMESFRYLDSDRFYIEKENIRDPINLPKKGWTREEIVAVYEADCFYGSQPPEMSPNVRDGLGWTLSVWDLWRKGSYGRISRRRRQEALLSDAKGDAASCAQELERIKGEEQRDREALERATELAEKADKSDTERSPQDQEELDRRFNLLTYTWFGHNYLTHKYGFEPRVKESKLRPRLFVQNVSLDENTNVLLVLRSSSRT
ncbi:hypothetical protein FPRO04_02621 [Fusarium proliferatum]|nr:hypothetical protein FPRO04_02621 [Fusarium proliferatum]